jgi:hypothetical protein
MIMSHLRRDHLHEIKDQAGLFVRIHAFQTSTKLGWGNSSLSGIHRCRQ